MENNDYGASNEGFHGQELNVIETHPYENLSPTKELSQELKDETSTSGMGSLSSDNEENRKVIEEQTSIHSLEDETAFNVLA